MLRYFQLSHFHKTMKSSPKPLKPSRVIPILSRVFPHKLKFLSHGSLSFPPKSRNNSVVRRFSTSSRTGPRSGSGPEVRALKSLIDNEADLSDWVGGLSSKDSKKARLCSDSDKEIDNGIGKSRGRDGEMEDGRGEKRRKESGLEKFKGRGNRGRGGGLGDRFSGGRESGGGNGNVGRGDGRGGNERGSGGSRLGGRFGVLMESRGGRGIRSGGKDNTRRTGLELSDKDEDETEEQKGFKSFKELMGSGEEENDESDEEEEVDPINKESVLAWREKADGEKTSPVSSPSGGDSYLSQTR